MAGHAVMLLSSLFSYAGASLFTGIRLTSQIHYSPYERNVNWMMSHQIPFSRRTGLHSKTLSGKGHFLSRLMTDFVSELEGSDSGSVYPSYQCRRQGCACSAAVLSGFRVAAAQPVLPGSPPCLEQDRMAYHLKYQQLCEFFPVTLSRP